MSLPSSNGYFEERMSDMTCVNSEPHRVHEGFDWHRATVRNRILDEACEAGTSSGGRCAWTRIWQHGASARRGQKKGRERRGEERMETERSEEQDSKH